MPAGDSNSSVVARKVALACGVIYFSQGFGDPTSGLVAQPTRSLLKQSSFDVQSMAVFMFVLSAPWYLKPLFGFLTDFVPFMGSRRRSYLLTSSLCAAVAFLGAWVGGLRDGGLLLLVCLFVPCMGLSISDVVVDAMSVENGQLLRITGRLQSIQWTAYGVAGVLSGLIGGYLAQHRLEQIGFLICGALSFTVFATALFLVDEKRNASSVPTAVERFQRTLSGISNRRFISIAALLVAINFTPFSGDVIYVHMTEHLKFSEQLVGTLSSTRNVASILACLLYGVAVFRLGTFALVAVAICGITASAMAHWAMHDATTAFAVSSASSFFFMISNLAQLDLAARFCPRDSAGTIFAILMSLCNLSVSASRLIGGIAFAHLEEVYNAHVAFNSLVFLAVCTSTLCWVFVFVSPTENDDQ